MAAVAKRIGLGVRLGSCFCWRRNRGEIVRNWLCILGLFACLSATAAQADDGDTVFSSVKPSFDGGELTGCQVNFSVMHRNPEYFGNDAVVVDVGILISGKISQTPSALFKIGVAKVGGALSGQFQAPTNVYLVNDLKTNIADKVQQIPSETPGYALFIYKLDKAMLDILFNAFESGKFELAYSMNNGSSGSKFVADIHVAKNDDGNPVRDATAVDRLGNCFFSLPYMKAAMEDPANRK